MNCIADTAVESNHTQACHSDDTTVPTKKKSSTDSFNS